MKKNIQFTVEGFADSVLLKLFSIPAKYISVGGGSFGVARTMNKQSKNFHKIVIGLVDIDKKNNPGYFDTFTLIDNPDEITYKRKNESNQYLISLCCNGVENWINKAAESVKVSRVKYNLPEDFKDFLRITKHETVLRNIDFFSYLTAIKNSGADSFICLKKVLEKHILTEWKY